MAAMEPPIQYARTSDGVNIAFWTLGEGVPLIIPPADLVSHVRAEWQLPARRAAYERLAQRARIVRYDRRGMGMSQRDAVDFSVEAEARDLEAVADRLELDSFALIGINDATWAYSEQHPERVSHLAAYIRERLWDTSEAGRQAAAIEPLIEQEWDLFVEVFTRLFVSWDNPDAPAVASAIRASHSPESMREVVRLLRQGPLPERSLAGIRVPALILYPLSEPGSERLAGSVAAAIPNARLIGIPGEPPRPVLPNDAGLAAILDFITTRPAAPGQAIAAPQLDTSAFRAVLITDIEAHTPVMERLGDAQGRELMRECERITRDALRAHSGTEVKAMGDGFMASFASVQKALECAIDIQRAFEVQNADVVAQQPRDDVGRAQVSSVAAPLRVRIGINAGEPIEEEAPDGRADLFGNAVITASRIAAQAQGGEILVSDVVRQLVAGKGFHFIERGEHVLKGFQDPVRLFEVRWQPD
jgi:class 3 adenylate cyclase/pimeloyl-ACP methyl ester carboxylesterase